MHSNGSVSSEKTPLAGVAMVHSNRVSFSIFLHRQSVQEREMSCNPASQEDDDEAARVANNSCP